MYVLKVLGFKIRIKSWSVFNIESKIMASFKLAANGPYTSRMYPSVVHIINGFIKDPFFCTEYDLY